MLLLKLLMCTLTFYALVVNLDAGRWKCPKGQRLVNRGSTYCEKCHEGTYQPEENDSTICKFACTRCDESSGSVVKSKCTKEENTQCQCRSGFVARDDDSSTCKCDIGFGLSTVNGRKECSECEYGYFNTRMNSPCKKWTECKSAGVKTPGTTESDVICGNTSTTTRCPSNVISTRLTSLRPQEGTETQKMYSTTSSTTTTSSASGHTATPKVSVFHPGTGNNIGMALLIFGIAGLLVLTAVTCKLHITPYLERQPAEPENGSCRRPVEESGDGSLSPLKQNIEP